MIANSKGRPCKNFSIKQGFYLSAGQSKQPTSVGCRPVLKRLNVRSDTALVAWQIKTVSFIKIFIKP